MLYVCAHSIKSPILTGLSRLRGSRPGPRPFPVSSARAARPRPPVHQEMSFLLKKILQIVPNISDLKKIVCLYINININIYINISVCVYMYKKIYIHIYIYLYTNKFLYICIYSFIDLFVYLCI